MQMKPLQKQFTIETRTGCLRKTKKRFGFGFSFLPRSASPLDVKDFWTFTKQIWPQRPSKIAGVVLRETPRRKNSVERVTHVLDNHQGEGGERVCALSYCLAEHVRVCGMCLSCASARKFKSQLPNKKAPCSTPRCVLRRAVCTPRGC